MDPLVGKPAFISSRKMLADRMTEEYNLQYENALKINRRCDGKYDLIIVDSSLLILSVPIGGLFTREFYGNCYNALKDDGIMVNQQGSPFYTKVMHMQCQRMS